LDAIELAAVLVTLALLASIVSVELGVTVALVELTLGVVAGNTLDLQTQDWLTFVAAFAHEAALAGRRLSSGVTQRSIGKGAPSSGSIFSRPFSYEACIRARPRGASP
jgi:hypothetical protein